MSKKSLILALSRGAWLVSDNYISTYFPMVSKFLTGEPVSFFDDIEEENQAKSKPYAVALVSGSLKIFNSYDEAPQGSVAIIPVNGPILKEDNCGAPGTATLGSRLKQADEHPNISAHLLDIDSGGGSVDGTFEFADIIKNSASAGHKLITNGISKLYFASNQLLAMAIKILVSADNVPRKKYSNVAMVSICLRLAPNVRNNTASSIRRYLLMRTEEINTIIPVMMLKPAMK